MNCSSKKQSFQKASSFGRSDSVFNMTEMSLGFEKFYHFNGGEISDLFRHLA